MSRDLNRVMLIGRLGADPDMRYTPSGTPVTNFRIAVNRRVRQGDSDEAQEQPDWFGVVAWQKLAEICAQYLHRGSRVYIEGRLQTRQYETQDGQKRYVTEIVANDMIILDSRGGSTTGGDTGHQSEEDDLSGLDMNEIPF